MCCNDRMNDGAADKEAIELVKYRYLRALDTKDWDEFADTLAENVTGDYGDRLHFTNRTELVDYMRSSLGPGVLTEHRVTHPEIAVDGDEARATWYLQDRVIAAEFNFMLIGAAFYHDTYRRTADGWKISATAYDRTYEATMSLENLNFKIKPGRALHI
ncbi:nuclear transport factor 2 family protein [Mycobacterium sp.]|uniref:nuclear transport factor 2 family protein n=1 Tax=Mycobacterium sp. TaxID=1785 RepID=UPI002BE87B0B|nr:nuclear transport factor 2 family protein [Mycobacterium sp.]HME46830.1 nuclear transport factor 2 family protein [Mycobacterium sp.]